jgi:hypothetical protein
LRYAGVCFRYACGGLRYADDDFRYASIGLRYAGVCFRYASISFRYAGACFRYANICFRYANTCFRYAALRFRYANDSIRYANVCCCYASGSVREKIGKVDSSVQCVPPMSAEVCCVPHRPCRTRSVSDDFASAIRGTTSVCTPNGGRRWKPGFSSVVLRRPLPGSSRRRCLTRNSCACPRRSRYRLRWLINCCAISSKQQRSGPTHRRW